MTQLLVRSIQKVAPGIVPAATLLALLLLVPFEASANANSPAPAPAPTTEECFNDSQGLGLICVPTPKAANGGNRQAEPAASPVSDPALTLERWLLDTLGLNR